MSKYCPWADACEEALNAEAEIELLRAENTLAGLHLKDGIALVERMKAEIERLQGLHKFSETASQHERDGLRAEIERLRGAIAYVWQHSARAGEILNE